MWEHVYPFSAIVGQDAMKKFTLYSSSSAFRPVD